MNVFEPSNGPDVAEACKGRIWSSRRDNRGKQFDAPDKNRDILCADMTKGAEGWGEREIYTKWMGDCQKKEKRVNRSYGNKSQSPLLRQGITSKELELSWNSVGTQLELRAGTQLELSWNSVGTQLEKADGILATGSLIKYF
ncbi:uncharacterized protein LOC111332400 [Stylophora pistillata]|uniref:uncharacterized protein LOC111332400 n=1 Tax=Stylophora pistillata TaxID=50429 RepID=UPI000C04FEB2|nr:uncharacterized protein LOC111332400 [Stylophora pistillata]